MSTTMNDVPRRSQLDQCTPAELAIYQAMDEVEKVGGDVRLTNAIIKLNEARNLVADFVDKIVDRKNLPFGEAIEALKQGKRVQRAGWNGKGMFIFMRPADEIPIDMVINKVKSLPQNVKDYYLQDVIYKGTSIYPADENDKVKFTAYLCMKAADGTIVNGWLASQTDMLAEDWIILD